MTEVVVSLLGHDDAETRRRVAERAPAGVGRPVRDDRVPHPFEDHDVVAVAADVIAADGGAIGPEEPR